MKILYTISSVRTTQIKQSIVTVTKRAGTAPNSVLFPLVLLLHNLDFSVQICHCLLLLFLGGFGVNVHCGGDVCVTHDVLNDF